MRDTCCKIVGKIDPSEIKAAMSQIGVIIDLDEARSLTKKFVYTVAFLQFFLVLHFELIDSFVFAKLFNYYNKEMPNTSSIDFKCTVYFEW